MNKWTTQRIRGLKGREKFACLTAHDWGTARLLDAAGIPVVLVGDSLGMTALGYPSTLPVTLDQMLHHTAAVARGVSSALVVADMPFLSYQVSVSQAVDNAGRLLKEAGADAVKIEGGSIRRETVRALVANGIPVMGHIGLTPQSVHQMGGYRLQGRTAAEARGLLEDARALEEAGVFCIVLECIPAALGADITKSVAVPTLGIGAGPHCDGQVLVTADLLGLTAGPSPRFVKRYADLGTETARAFESFRHDVSSGAFPGPEHSYQPVAS